MGLGKTLTVLALICWYLDKKDTDIGEDDSRPSSTLIVAPKSSEYSHPRPRMLVWPLQSLLDGRPKSCG